MRYFSSYERDILASYGDALFPPTDVLTESAADIGLIDRLETHLGSFSPSLRAFFRVALVAFDILAVFSKGKFFRFLSQSKRISYIESWRQSRLYPRRLVHRLLEANCQLNYYSHPRISAKIGYHVPAVASRQGEPAAHISGTDRDLTWDVDVCVIGAGAGGAVVAKELAEKGRTVAILEEGIYATSRDFGSEPLEMVQKLYRYGGMQPTIGFPLILIPTGKAVGGTTIVNSGTCFRLPDKILHSWQEHFGLKELSPDALSPYFDRVEKHLHIGDVEDPVLGSNARIFMRGLERMGLKGAPLKRNVLECKGAGRCCFGCPNDAKQSVNLSYIPKAVAAGAKLATQCRVTSVLPLGDRAAVVTGEFQDGRGRTLTVNAKNVVFAAGTLNTPYLLKKNRIHADHPDLGRHLTIHPSGKIIGLFEEEVKGWEGVPQGFYHDGLAAEGIMVEGIFTPPSLASFNIGLPPAEHKKIMEQFSHVASFGFMISDTGGGTVKYLPNGDPLIFYSMDKQDAEKYKKALRFLCEVFLKAGAKKIMTGFHPIPVITSESGLEEFDRTPPHRTDFELAAFHPLGTCRMGSDPKTSLVDGYGQIHGYQNLFVADGSIFPSPLGVNPQESIMAFATRTADYIHENKL